MLNCQRAILRLLDYVIRNGQCAIGAGVKLCLLIKFEGIAFEMDLILLAARTSGNVNVVFFTAIVASSQIEERTCGVLVGMVVGDVITVAAGLRYGNTCFAVLIVLIIKYVGIFVNVMCIYLRFVIIRTNFLACHLEGVMVMAVGVAAFFLVVVIQNACEAAGRASIRADGMFFALRIGVIRFGNMAEITPVVVDIAILSARTNADMEIPLTCPPLGEVICFHQVGGVVVAVILVLIITVAASLRYGDTRFAILIALIVKYIGVFQIVVRVAFPLAAVRTNILVTHLVGIDLVGVGKTAFSLRVIISYTRQTAGRTSRGFKRVFDACVVGVGLRRYVIEVTEVTILPSGLSARTLVNTVISAASTVFGKVIILYQVIAVIRAMAFVMFIAVAAGLRYGNTRFAILICFIIEYVNVLVLMIGCVLPTVMVRADDRISHLEGKGLIAVGEAALSLGVTISYTRQTAGRTSVGLECVFNPCAVGVGFTGYVSQSAVVGAGGIILTAGTLINIQMSIACTKLGEIIFFDAIGIVVVAVFGITYGLALFTDLADVISVCARGTLHFECINPRM